MEPLHIILTKPVESGHNEFNPKIHIEKHVKGQRIPPMEFI